jgi:aldehyde dehydrogenase (NAD+)
MSQTSQTERPEPELAADADWNCLLIGGTYHAAGDRETISVSDPSTREEWKRVPAGTVDDVDAAYEAAERAQASWADRSPDRRAALLQEVYEQLEAHEEAITELLVAESGSGQLKANMEIQTALDDVAEATTFPSRTDGDVRDSTIAGKENLVKREPAGVVAVIPPWNFPFHLAMRAVAPAVALGNAVVIKPASETPVTSGLAIARLFELARRPLRLVSVVSRRRP